MLTFIIYIGVVVSIVLNCEYFVFYLTHVKMNKEDELPMGAHLTYAEFIKFLDDIAKSFIMIKLSIPCLQGKGEHLKNATDSFTCMPV